MESKSRWGFGLVFLVAEIRCERRVPETCRIWGQFEVTQGNAVMIDIV